MDADLRGYATRLPRLAENRRPSVSNRFTWIFDHGLHGAAQPQPGSFFTRISRMGLPDKATAMGTCRSAPGRKEEGRRFP
jgi:hypothetical protein